MIAELPPLLPGQLEAWLIPAVTVMGIVLLAKKLFIRKPAIEVEFVTKAEFQEFKKAVDEDMDSLRDKIDARFFNLGEKLEEIKSEILSSGERRGQGIHARINEIEASVARVDERTKAFPCRTGHVCP